MEIREYREIYYNASYSVVCSMFYDIELQSYGDLKIRVRDKDSIPFA